MATQANAYELLKNGSVFHSAVESYEAAWGDFFWPVMFLFVLYMVYLKTESPTMVALAMIVGNVGMFTLVDIRFQPILYITLVVSIALTLYSFVGRD